MAHTHVPYVDGYAVANDGGRNKIMLVYGYGATTHRPDAETAARLLALAYDLPGGLEAAIERLKE